MEIFVNKLGLLIRQFTILIKSGSIPNVQSYRGADWYWSLFGGGKIEGETVGK